MKGFLCLTYYAFLFEISCNFLENRIDISQYLIQRKWDTTKFATFKYALKPNKIRRDISKVLSENKSDGNLEDESKEIKKFIAGVEETIQQNKCSGSRPSLVSNRLPSLERTLLSTHILVTNLLAETITSFGVNSADKNFLEVLAVGAVHSVEYLKSIEAYIQPDHTGQPETFFVVSKSSSRLTKHDNASSHREIILHKVSEIKQAIGNKLKKICKPGKIGVKIYPDVVWTKPYSTCNDQVLLGFFAIIYSCNASQDYNVKSYVEVTTDLYKIDIDQCSKDASNPFANSNRCPKHSICRPIKNYGLRDGGYTCTCARGHHSPRNQETINGSIIIENEAKHLDVPGCPECMDGGLFCSPFVVSDVVIITVLSAHIIIMLGMLLPGFMVAKLRKTKTMNFNFWQLYEVMIGGGLLVYLSVAVEYTEATAVTCILTQWLREIGFVTLYSSMMLKTYRVRIECRSRQAQRVLLRDKDLVRYLAVVLFLAIWQMVAWSVIGLERILDDRAMRKTNLIDICQTGMWHHVVEIEEFVFLSCLLYMSCSLNPPPSFLIECRVITFALANEAVFSAIHNIIKYLLRSSFNQINIFILSFVRCHLTITVNLTILLGIKLWQARTSSHVVSSCRRKDGSSINAKDTLKTVIHEPLKNQSSSMSTSKKSQDNKDSNDMNLSGLNPEDVKAELRRLYKQLEIYKAKTSRKDVSHAIKKQAARKQGPRRFSLYNFHHARHSKHHPTLTDKNRCLDDSTEKEPGINEHSRITPEESTNSCEAWNLVPTLS